MKIGIVICSSADLPHSFIVDNDINVMPISLKFKKNTFIDVRDPDATQAFYKQYLINKNIEAETAPYSVKQISDWFLDELVLKYDRVLVLCIASSRSPIYDNATKASFAILQGYKQKRRDAEIKGSFALRVMDTKSLFAGEAIIAHEAVRLIKEEHLPFAELRPRIEELTRHVYAFSVPNDLYFLRNRARKKGDRTISLTKYWLAKIFDIKPITAAHSGETFSVDKGKGFDATVEKLFIRTRAAIDKGLRVPLVCMSYAGNPNDITTREDYKEFIQYAEQNAIHHTMAVMSTTAGINMGPGTFALAYATMD